MVVKLPFEDEKKIKEIVEILKNGKKFLITSHINIDGDCIGSEIALGLLLERIGKKVEIINQDKVPRIYKFLPGIKKIKNFPSPLNTNFDVGIVIDCGNLERIGKTKDIVEKIPLIVNIDHHFTNYNFGDVNWINSIFSSSGEMVYFLCKEIGEIDKKIATCLYAAILTDTCCFVHRLSPFTIDVIKDLIEKGINPEKIAQKIYFERSVKAIELFKLALRTLKFDRKNKICLMKVTREMYKKAKAKEEDTEGFVEFLTTIKGVEVGILFKEKENGIKVSMRSKWKINVDFIARKFGGGGHKEAAGCFFPNKNIEEVEKILIEEIENEWNLKYK